jgi:YD repeat-containing protein
MQVLIYCRKHFAFFCFLIPFILITAVFACPPKDPPTGGDPTAGDPVSITSGKVYSSHEDLLIPGRGGLSLEISRHYYSKSSYFGAFGRRWSFTYGMSVTQDSSTSAILINEKGRSEKYTWNGSSWTPPTGKFSVLTKNPDNSWTLKRKEGMVYNFDTEGKPINITDRNDNHINLVYTNGLLTSVTDDNGRTLTFSYNGNGLISFITWPNGEATAYEYDGHSNLNKVTDPEGNQINYSYSYYNTWELTAVIDANGNMTSYSLYDENPADINYLKCKRITYADNTPDNPDDNPHMDFFYNESLRFTLVTDENGHSTKYEYNGDENVTVVTDPKNNPTTTAYDADFNKINVTYVADAREHTIIYTYDGKGNCLSVKDPLNRVGSFTYEPNFCFVKTATDVKGNTTTYYYDYEEATLGDLNGDGITNQENGNLVKIVYPAVSAGTPTELFVYNQYGQIIQQTDPKGTITKYDYYPATGYLEKKTADYGGAPHINAVTRFEYDTVGNITSVTDPNGNTTTNEYNKISLLTKTISPPPFNYQTKYTYDGNKNLIKTEKQVSQ